MQELYKYDGTKIYLDSPLPKIKVPPVFNSVLSSELIYTCTVTGDVQSCCANGNIVWYADITNKTINRYDTLNGTLTSGSISTIGHANGMTYCDEDDCIYVDTMTNNVILKIDASTLQLLDSITVNHDNVTHYGVSWNRSTREFYVRTGSSLVQVFDYDFTYLRDITLSVWPDSGTRQTVETDGTFLYLTWCEGTSYYTDSAQHIYIYTLDGEFLKDVKPYCAELETLVYNGYGDYYISICRGSSGYGQIRKVTNPLSADVPSTNGTYMLKATVTNNKATYTWESVT